MQDALPGVKLLVAITGAAGLGQTVSAFDIMPYLLYPYLLLVSSLVFIFLVPEKK